MDAETANADLATAARLISGSLAFYEGPSSPLSAAQIAEVKTLHHLLTHIAQRAEVLTGVSGGTLAIRPADGTNKC